jgi:putative ABC transport system permease protein
MTLPLVIYRSLRRHALSTLVTAGSIALAGRLLVTVWMVKDQAQSAFTRPTTSFDAVIKSVSSTA